MLDFNYYVPTKILFGKNKIVEISDQILEFGKNVLLVYGSSSIKKSGLHENVLNLLSEKEIKVFELSGVCPNPHLSSVREGIDICSQNNINFVLAVGGGSVIDCAKAISAGACVDFDVWDFFLRKKSIEKALPLGTVLTLAATGSEMNGYAVVTNEKTQEKLAAGSDCLRPKFSVLDPTYTYSVSKIQTIAGVIDIYSHVLEQYFDLEENTCIQDRLAESLLKVCIEYGPKAIKEPTNYNARANLMWTSSLALNGLLSYGRSGDWSTHYIEHSVSAVYDVTHGLGLGIITPFWMEYVLGDETVGRLAQYSKNVWNVESNCIFETAKKGIEATKHFFKSIGAPTTLSEVGVKKDSLDELAKKTVLFGDIGVFRKLNQKDILNILEMSY